MKRELLYMSITFLFLASLVVIMGCEEPKKTVDPPKIADSSWEDEGLSGFKPWVPEEEITPKFGTFLSKGGEKEDLGGTTLAPDYYIKWEAGQAPIDPILDSMISRLEFMQQTTSGSTANQKKLFELVDLKRRLTLITDE